jgi:hypothetical protein
MLRSKISLGRVAIGVSTMVVALMIASPSGAAPSAARLSTTSHVQAAPSWGAAEEAPGTAGINAGGTAAVTDISCTKVGDCVAVGTYAVSSAANADFVDVESGGTWAAAQEVPGYAVLNTGTSQDVSVSVDCPSTGNCTVVGSYTGTGNYVYPFTDTETNGTWANALELTGFPAGNGDDSATLDVLSCTGVGDCTVSGVFNNGAITPYAAAESHGVWGSPVALAGLSTLATGGESYPTSLSCSSAGNCGETGFYTTGSGTTELSSYVVNETNGTWGSAIAIPGLVALNVGNLSVTSEISCPATGDCVVGGEYALSSTQADAFIAIESGGTWGSAEVVPGTASLNVDLAANVDAVSCSSATTCVVGGTYEDSAGSSQAFVEDETNGNWATATEVPGTATLNNGGDASIFSTSCSSPGNCAATGVYTDSQGNVQTFVVNQRSGTWGSAIELAGLQALNLDGYSEGLVISCATDGSCGVGGDYTDGSNDSQAFVAGSNATLSVPSAPSIRAKSSAVGAITVSLKSAVANGGDPVTEYEYSLNGGAWIKAGTSGTVTIRHLKAKDVYHVRLRALNTLGAGATSGSLSVTVV